MIYFLRRDDGLVKIGTTTNYRARLSQLIAEHGDLELLGLMAGNYKVERQLHEQFAADNVEKEWFHPSDGLMDYVNRHAHLSIPDEPIPTGVKVSSHTQYALDLLAVRLSATDGGSKTHDDVVWYLIGRYDPSVISEVERWLGEKPKVRRGRVKLPG